MLAGVRKAAFALCFSLLLLTKFGFGQNTNFKSNILLSQVFSDYNAVLLDGDPTPFDSSLSLTNRLSYQRSYNNRWEGYAGLSNGFRQYYTIENEDYNKVYSFAVDAGIKYVLFAQPNNRQLRRFSPFLSAGYYLEYLHGLRETENQLYLSNGQYGLGFVSEFSPRLGLQSSVIITQKLQDDFNTFLQYRAGLYFKVGKSQSTPIENIEEIDNPVVEGVIEPEYLVNLRDSIDQVSQRFDSLNSSNLTKIKRLEQLNKVLKDSLSSNEK